MLTRVAAVVMAAGVVFAACAVPDAPPRTTTGRPTAGAEEPDRNEPRPAEAAASCVEEARADGTLTCPATGLGSRPPAWLGTRELSRTDAGFGEVLPTPPALRHRRFTRPDTVRPLPGRRYAVRIVSPAPARVLARSTWRSGCPVGRRDLAWVRLTFWGFDAARHTGELLVHRTVAGDVAEVFGRLYRARFPMEQVVIVRRYDPDAPPTGDGNGTGGFVCRQITGKTGYSQHAYGLAVDLNTFQNPYQKGEVVLPELASSYLDRAKVRPGMITPDGPVVEAFEAIGWRWGGTWSTLKDYQHFSRNGR